MHKGTVTPDEARACVRALVGVIRSASSGSSPVDDGQVAHLKKVVKVLSLSDEQIEQMLPEEQQQVIAIREAAVTKMRMANKLQGPPHAPPPGFSGPGSGSQPGSFDSSSPGGFAMAPPPSRPTMRPTSISEPPPYTGSPLHSRAAMPPPPMMPGRGS